MKDERVPLLCSSIHKLFFLSRVFLWSWNHKYIKFNVQLFKDNSTKNSKKDNCTTFLLTTGRTAITEKLVGTQKAVMVSFSVILRFAIASSYMEWHWIIELQPIHRVAIFYLNHLCPWMRLTQRWHFYAKGTILLCKTMAGDKKRGSELPYKENSYVALFTSYIIFIYWI